MYEKIPLELKQLPHWVGWKYMQRPGEDHKRKVPINAMDGQPAKSNDPTTWCDFDTACLGKERFGLDGIGFMFSGDGIFGIDIDHCYDPETQELDPAAAEIIETVQSYTELSPSGTGTGSTTASYIEERLICAVAVGNAAVTAVLSSEQYASYDDLQDHVADADNPHKVTKAQVGLGSVDNTSDVDKPVSTAQAAAIAACKVSVKSVTMLAASWVGSDPYTQQVVVDGAAANSKVDIQLSAEQHAALGDLGIDFLQIENANGTLTAKVKGGKPTSDLTVQVTIVGVVQ